MNQKILIDIKNRLSDIKEKILHYDMSCDDSDYVCDRKLFDKLIDEYEDCLVDLEYEVDNE